MYTVGAKPDGDPDDVALCLVSKQIAIHQLPQVLILHVKRFTIEFDGVFKDTQHISFPFKLNMAPYCTRKCMEVCQNMMPLLRETCAVLVICMAPLHVMSSMYTYLGQG